MKKKEAKKIIKYFFAIGRRKTARALVKLFPEGTGQVTANLRNWKEYFPTSGLQKIILEPLNILGLERKVNIEVKLVGGGIVSQARALSLGLARALVKLEPNCKTVLKKQGLLTRDSRKKERKKPGLKRARRAPQWQKR